MIRCALILRSLAAAPDLRSPQVEMIRGKDKGKKGVVTRVLRERNKVIVEGLNLVRTLLPRR